MKTKRGVYKNRSVLNTDAFDRRRFKQIFNLSTGLKKLVKEKPLPEFDALLADIWASLYKMKPEIKSTEVEDVLLVNQQLMKRVMQDESYVQLHAFTKLNDVMALIGTVKIGTAIQAWLVEKREEDEDFQKLMKKNEDIQLKLQQHRIIEEEGMTNLLVEAEQKEAMGALNAKLRPHLIADGPCFSEKLVQVTEELKQTEKDLQTLVGGGSGNAKHALKKIPLRDLLSLAEKISTHQKMKEIALWAGRFKSIVQKKEESVQEGWIEKSDLSLGNTIEKLLPTELGLFMHPRTRKDFYYRFIEGQTMQYEEESTERLGKGPIVLCLDQSGSMHHVEAQSKGFMFALLLIARKQKRDVHVILFSTQTQVYTYKNGVLKAADISALTQIFLGGGTNFERPLIEAMHAVNGSRFKKADILFMTDGENELDALTLTNFNRQREKHKCRVLSIVMGNRLETVKSFSDRVIQLDDLNGEGNFTTIEL